MDGTRFQKAYDELKALGLVLKPEPGQYRVFFHHAADPQYLTDDLDDALQRGREMAANPPPPPEPPLGPTKPRSRRRAFMYKHNRILAARRLRKQSKTK
jgi:hypothetical protein